MSTSITPKVIRVRGEVRYTAQRAGLLRRKAGYRYIAVLEGGTEEVIRTKATLRYEWAYQWISPVAKGQGAGLAAHFTYSSSRGPPSHAL